MPSAYLLNATEAVNYGAATGTTTAQIQAASSLIDAFLKRPEGLVFGVDQNGVPAYMLAQTATYAYTLTAAILPGSNVPVSLTGGPLGVLQVGDILLLDRPNLSAPTEACVVATTTGTGQSTAITLQTVQFAHSIGAAAEYGMVIEEQKYMPDSRPLTTLSRAPTVNILSGVGRYGYGRRGDGANYNMEQFNLLAALSKFGGPPVWELFQSTYQSTWDVNTGEVWVPAGIMLAYYSEVKLRYVAGFAVNAIPTALKLACATIIQAVIANPRVGNVKSYRAGDTEVESFSASIIDDDTKKMLFPYAANLFV